MLTTIFADTDTDTDHARAAGDAVRTMHAHARWTDPITGEDLRADTPAWLDPATMALTRAELDVYIDERSAWMALTLPAAEASEGLRYSRLMGNPLEMVPAALVQAGIATLLPKWARQLYGIREGRLRRTLSRRAMSAMLAAGRKAAPIDQRLRSTLADVDAHPYRKTRAEHQATLQAVVERAA